MEGVSQPPTAHVVVIYVDSLGATLSLALGKNIVLQA